MACTAIYPSLIVSSFSSIIGGLFYIGAVCIKDSSISLLSMTIFNTGISIYMNVTPLMIMYFIKSMREKVMIYLCHLGRVKCETLDANEVYFQQLNAQWNK